MKEIRIEQMHWPAHTVIQDTHSRLHAIDPIIERYATSLFPAGVAIFKST